MRKIEAPIRVNTKEITTDFYFTGVVRQGNKHSARLNVPVNLLGRKVIVVVLPNGGI